MNSEGGSKLHIAKLILKYSYIYLAMYEAYP